MASREVIEVKGKRENPDIKANETPGIRADFMRRWFAVAVSVGFASTVNSMLWVHVGAAPSPTEWQQIARLTVAMIATLLSWEGYLLSTAGKPLYDFPRFAIDVILVLVYLVLLISSSHGHYWLWLHAVTFVLYLLWDYLTVRDPRHRDRFTNDNAPKEYVPTPREVYVGGLKSDRNINPGPVITIFAAVYFTWLPILQFLSGINTYTFAIFVLLGLIAYRIDKSYRLDIVPRLLLWGGLTVTTLVSWLSAQVIT